MFKPIRTTVLMLFLSTVLVTLYAQVQIGATITATEEDFAFGQNVQLSNDGKRLAVSGYGTSKNGFALFNNINGDWVEESFKETSNFPDRTALYSIAMSSEGTTIVVGAVINKLYEDFGNVKVFHYVNNNWVQKGNTITGASNAELFGKSVAISDDGNRVIVGARLNSELVEFGGRVGVYEYANATWSQLGGTILGSDKGFKIGTSVAISGDGAQIFMGTNSASIITRLYFGQVERRTLENNVWSVRDLKYGKKYDHYGLSVAVSNDGQIFAAGGSQFWEGNGYITLYRNDNGTLNRINTIKGVDNNEIGSSMALSGDGNRVVVASVLRDYAINAGSVSILENNGTAFLPIGKIEGTSSIPKFGRSVAIAGDGNTIAIGALDYNHTAVGTEIGSVRVYDISELKLPDPEEPVGSEGNQNIDFIIYPSPATSELICENCESLIEWYLADVTGKKVVSNQSKTPNIIDVSILQTGIYYAYFIQANKEVTVKKIIKN